MNKEILTANYWEHFKYAKELSRYLPIDDPKRVRVEKEITRMTEQLNWR